MQIFFLLISRNFLSKYSNLAQSSKILRQILKVKQEYVLLWNVLVFNILQFAVQLPKFQFWFQAISGLS